MTGHTKVARRTARTAATTKAKIVAQHKKLHTKHLKAIMAGRTTGQPTAMEFANIKLGHRRAVDEAGKAKRAPRRAAGKKQGRGK